MQILVQRAAQKKQTLIWDIGWFQTRHKRSFSLNEHSFSKNAHEIFLIHSLMINGNWAETQVQKLNETNVTRSCELNKS